MDKKVKKINKRKMVNNTNKKELEEIKNQTAID